MFELRKNDCLERPISKEFFISPLQRKGSPVVPYTALHWRHQTVLRFVRQWDSRRRTWDLSLISGLGFFGAVYFGPYFH